MTTQNTNAPAAPVNPLERNIHKIGSLIDAFGQMAVEINQMQQVGLLLPQDAETAMKALHDASVPIEAAMGRLTYQAVAQGQASLQFVPTQGTDGEGGQAGGEGQTAQPNRAQRRQK